MKGIVAGQATWNWNVAATGVVPFLVFVVAGTAELNRPPFDLVEAEQELVGGFHTEYSSIRFALFYLAEFMNMITMSAIAVTLFLGGPNGPILIDRIAWVWPVLWFFLKVLAFLFTFVWLRATLPRLRYDQLMDLGWKVLIPVSLGWFLLVAALAQPANVRPDEPELHGGDEGAQLAAQFTSIYPGFAEHSPLLAQDAQLVWLSTGLTVGAAVVGATVGAAVVGDAVGGSHAHS
mgnify:CR=1 FL=1